ncbi:MAG: Hsp20/alpha crystallin family protein [Acidobacteriota bacterium]
MVKGYGPILEIARIQNEINRLFENLFDLKSGRGMADVAWLPSTDVCECDEHMMVKVEVPGVVLKDLKLFINGSNIIIEGEKKKSPDGGGKKKFRQLERSYGKFRRVININEAVNTHKADAVLKDGLLKIRFPKVSNKRGEQVEIAIREE